MPRRSWWPALVLAALVGCSKSPDQPPPSQTGERITGNEKVGWTQPATDSVELAEFSYAIYVDGARSQLASVSCGDTPSSAGFDCNAPLPRMSSGSHTLQIAAFIDNNGTPLESSKSTPLQVIVSTSVSAGRRAVSPQPLPDTLSATTADGVHLRIDVVSRSVDTPTDIAAAPDGRLFVAERGGSVRVVREGDRETPAAASLFDREPAGATLIALAIDPRFDSTHFVYTISAARGRNGGPTFVLSRFREAHDTFGDRAVLVDEVPASGTPAASLRFGPDGKLYAALDDGDDPAVAGDLAAFNGKILRLNADGSTPDDQAGATPVYSYEYRSPRGFDWQPASGTLWIADGAPGLAARLRAVGVSAARPRRSTTLINYSVPGLFGASSAAFYRGELLPAFRGDLFLAADAGQHLLRIRFDRQSPTRVIATERLLEGAVGGVRVVFVRADGTMFLGTSHELLRVGPAP